MYALAECNREGCKCCEPHGEYEQECIRVSVKSARMLSEHNYIVTVYSDRHEPIEIWDAGSRICLIKAEIA